MKFLDQPGSPSMNVGGQRRQPRATTSADVQRKLALGRERLEKADKLDGDPDLLSVALLSYHGALEDHLRIWVSRNQYVRAEYRQADIDKHNVTWRELRESLEDHGSLPYQLRDLPRFIKEYNQLRQPVGHGDRIQESANIRQYAEIVETAIDSDIPCARVGGISSSLTPAERGQSGQHPSANGLVVALAVLAIVILVGLGLNKERGGHVRVGNQVIDQNIEQTSEESSDLADQSSQESPRGDPIKKRPSKRRVVRRANAVARAGASAPAASSAKSPVTAEPDASRSELDALNSSSKGASLAPGAKRRTTKGKVDVSPRELEEL